VHKMFEEALAATATTAPDTAVDPPGDDDVIKKKDKTKDKVPESFHPLKAILEKDIPADKVDIWAEMVDRTYRAHITLITEPANATELKDKVKATDAFKLRGVSGSSYIAFFYCYASSAESTTSPHKRSAPYQDTHASKLIHSMLEARLDSDERSIAPGDMYLLSDNGKFGLGPRFMNLFKWAGDAAEVGRVEVPT
jgi:hypothetical protein